MFQDNLRLLEKSGTPLANALGQLLTEAYQKEGVQGQVIISLKSELVTWEYFVDKF